MTKRRPPDMRILADGDDGLDLAMQRMAAMAAQLEPASSWADFQKQRPAIIEHAARVILKAAERYDAFDVIESMRMREYPLGLIGFSEQQHDGLAIAVEVCALVLTCRGQRAAVKAEGSNAGEAVPAIHAEAEKLLMASAMTAASESERLSQDDPIGVVATALSSSEVSIRNRQYKSIRESHDARLFGDPNVTTAMKVTLGFTFEEFAAVRDAIPSIGSEKFFAARDLLGEIAEEWRDGAFKRQSEGRIAEGRKAVENMMTKPGRRAAFSVAELAQAAGLEEQTVVAILRPFSAEFVKRDPVAALNEHLANPTGFAHVALVVDAEGNYLPIGPRLGDDSLRQVVERALSGSKAQEAYVRARTRMSEGLAAEYLERTFHPDQVLRGFKYFQPRAGFEASSLSREIDRPTLVGDETEMDALLICGDVLLCVEVKGKSVRPEARAGNRVKLASDLRSIVGEATHQADRVRALVETNGGLWTPSGWFDLQHAREAHSVAVALDDLGPAGISLDELVRAGMVETDRLPWIVSLHDLAIICSVVDTPAELLLYLRRRTEPDFAKVYAALDELDLFMLFMSGGLYLDPDPDKMWAAHPVGQPPTSAERRKYRDQLVPTHVGTHTDPLDAWMYAKEAGEPLLASKPEFATEERIRRLVAFVQGKKTSARVRASADLLSLSGPTQRRIADAIEDVAERTRADGKWHNFMISTTGWSGRFGLFVGSQPNGMPNSEAKTQLAAYANAKSHQIHADRWLAVVVSPNAELRTALYVDRDFGEPEQLEVLVEAMRLVPANRTPRTLPPSARRATRRLPKRKKK